MPDINDLQQKARLHSKGPVLGFSYSYLQGKDTMYNNIKEKAKRAGRLDNFDSDFYCWMFWLTNFPERTIKKEFGSLNHEPNGGDAAYLTDRSMGMTSPKINSPYEQGYILKLFANATPEQIVDEAQQGKFHSTRYDYNTAQFGDYKKLASLNNNINDLIKLIASKSEISIEKRAEYIKEILVAPENDFIRLRLEIQDLKAKQEQEKKAAQKSSGAATIGTGTITIGGNLEDTTNSSNNKLINAAIIVAAIVLIIIIFKKII